MARTSVSGGPPEVEARPSATVFFRGRVADWQRELATAVAPSGAPRGSRTTCMTRTLPIERFPERTLPRLVVSAARRAPAKTFLRQLAPGAPEAPPRTSPSRTSPQASGVPPRSCARPESARATRPHAGRELAGLADGVARRPGASRRARRPLRQPGRGAGPGHCTAGEAAGRVRRSAGAVGEARAHAPELAAAGLVAVVSAEPLAPDAVPPGVRTATPDEVFPATGLDARRARGARARRGRGGSVPPALHERHHRAAQGRAPPAALHRPRHRRRALLVRPGPDDLGSTSSPSRTSPVTTSSTWRWPRDARAPPGARAARTSSGPSRSARPTPSRCRSSTTGSARPSRRRSPPCPARSPRSRSAALAAARAGPGGGRPGLADRAPHPRSPTGWWAGAPREAGRPRARPLLGRRTRVAGALPLPGGARDPLASSSTG